MALNDRPTIISCVYLIILLLLAMYQYVKTNDNNTYHIVGYCCIFGSWCLVLTNLWKQEDTSEKIMVYHKWSLLLWLFGSCQFTSLPLTPGPDFCMLTMYVYNTIKLHLILPASKVQKCKPQDFEWVQWSWSSYLYSDHSITHILKWRIEPPHLILLSPYKRKQRSTHQFINT